MNKNDRYKAACAITREELARRGVKAHQLEKENRLLCDKLTHVHGLLQDLEEFMTRTNNWRNLPTGGAK